MYLLDTNVVSEMRRRRPNVRVSAWLDAVATNSVFLSAVTCGEIQSGIERLRRQDAEKAREIEAWLEELIGTSALLPMDATCFRLWARLMEGRSDTLYEDAMIAATAITHRLVVVTRNVRDFAALGVESINPWDARPE